MAKMNRELTSELTDLSSTETPSETLEDSTIKMNKRRYNAAWFGKRKDPKEEINSVVEYDNKEWKLPFQFYKSLIGQNLGLHSSEWQDSRQKKAVFWRPRTIFHKKWRPMLSYKSRKLTDTQNKRLSPFGLSHSNENAEGMETPKWSVKKFKLKVAKNEKDLKRFSNHHIARYIAR